MRTCTLLLLLLAGWAPLRAQSDLASYIPAHYDKQEVYVPMRDGTRLFTAIYTPKDASTEKPYPILLKRSCYSVKPYGPDTFMVRGLGPSETLVRAGFIFVHQDVRGRWMSEGTWTNMTPHLPDKSSPQDVDESSDGYDTIEWLLENVASHNGRVGQWGISYPGFYAAAALPGAHPALKAVSPQAPIADFYFDDFHHNGAYTLGYFRATPVFGVQKTQPVDTAWYSLFDKPTEDAYQFFMDMGPLKNGDRYMSADNFFWRELKTHPNYDAFWQRRDLLPHLQDIRPAVMTVGGWFDAEDLYGPLHIYRSIEQTSNNYNTLVMGPFGHGGWTREKGHHLHHEIYFGDSLATFYQREIEARFFRHFLKEAGDGDTGLPEAYLFDTGAKAWTQWETWPPAQAREVDFFLHPGRTLSLQKPLTGLPYSAYVSDPNQPVPYTQDIPGSFDFTPRNYMSEDQRFADRRPDVLTFQTPVLDSTLTLAGEIEVELWVSSTGEDADFVVKLIDVYPPDEPNTPHTPAHVSLGGYQQMVRSEIMRARFRQSFERPEPLVPGEIVPVCFKLQDVLHSFGPGHRLMVQVQSSWFPAFDRNPQTWVDNIFEAEAADFQAQTHRVYHTGKYASKIRVRVVE